MEEYTTDWVSKFGIPNFKYVKEQYSDIADILEIGSFEGRSACWMLKHMLNDTGTLTCIDPFPNEQLNPGDVVARRQIDPFDNRPYTLDDITFQRFTSNINQAKNPNQTVTVFRKLSYHALAELIVAEKQFDFIYVDGCHKSSATLTDACMCFGLLKPQGFMLFDDYLLANRPNVLDRGKMAIDAFMNTFSPNLEIHKVGYQVLVQKKV